MFIFQRYGHPDREKEIDYHVVSSVVEQLLVLANDAQQRAEALLAAPVANERGERHVRQR